MNKKKSITKADLGMSPLPQKALTKREKAIQEAQMIKQLERAKPVSQSLEEIWKEYKKAMEEMEWWKGILLKRAPNAIKEGYRFESFTYVKESKIPDRGGIRKLYSNRSLALPTKEEIDWKEAKTYLGKECPMKPKAAYLREVKP